MVYKVKTLTEKVKRETNGLDIKIEEMKRKEHEKIATYQQKTSLLQQEEKTLRTSLEQKQPDLDPTKYFNSGCMYLAAQDLYHA